MKLTDVIELELALSLLEMEANINTQKVEEKENDTSKSL